MRDSIIDIDKCDALISKLKQSTLDHYEVLSRQEEIVQDLTHMIVYKNFRDQKGINFDSFKSLPLDQPLEYPSTTNKKIISTKVKETETELCFTSEFEGGAVIYRHHHPDCTEVMTVTSGKFKFMMGKESDGTHESRILLKGQEVFIPCNKEHQVINLSSEMGTVSTKIFKI